MKYRLRKKDLLWALLYPFYQIIGTIRHEVSHAVWAWLEGAKITQFSVVPSVTDAGFTWGYVSWIGDISWLATVAPYFVDFTTFILYFVLLTRVHFKRRWLWFNLLVIGMLSPLIDSVWNYYKAIGLDTGDVSELLSVLPSLVVHSYFVLTILVYILGLTFIFRLKVDDNEKRVSE